MWRAQTAGQVVIKVVVTDDDDRYKRAKREMNLFKMFFQQPRICHLINSKAMDAPKKCVLVLQYHSLGSVQMLLDAGVSDITCLNADGTPCLRFKYIAAMAKDVLEGLKCLHEKKIVHRDIKPGNICVEVDPAMNNELRYTIIDLGAAVSIEVLKDEPRASDNMQPPATAAAAAAAVGFTGQFTSVAGLKLPLGTLLFMSPEQIDRRRTVDGRSDIFNLGVTLYKCVCGRFPFVQPIPNMDDEELALELIHAFARSSEADPLHMPINGGQPIAGEKLLEIITKALRNSRKERYESAEAMANEIEHLDRCEGRCEIGGKFGGEGEREGCASR